MPASESLSRKQISNAVGSDSLLLDFLKPFPNLLRQNAGDVAVSFDRMAKKLSGTKRAGVIQFRLTKGRQARCWSLALSPKECRVIDSEVDAPTFEVITSEKTWAAIASGQIAPLEAFVSGKLRVRGNIEMARSIVRRMHKR